MPSLDFSYSRSSFLLTTGLLVLAGGLITAIFASMRTDILSMGAVVALCGVVVYSYGLSPMLTRHTLTEDELVLRQGVLFKTAIPLASIKAVERWEKGPRKTGVYLVTRRRELFVTSRRSNLIVLQLREPRRIGMAFGRMAETVAFDCMEAEALYNKLNDRVTLSSPPPASSRTAWV